MSAESDVMVVAGILALLYRITPTVVGEGPEETATRNYIAEDHAGRRWFVKAYPRGTDLEAERQALALGEAARAAGVPVPTVRRTVSGEVIASAGGLSVSVTQYVADAETAEGGLSRGRWDAVGEAVGRLHRALGGVVKCHAHIRSDARVTAAS
ncbi:phosphotransferase [Streptomyces roseolus]|uniref:phosphotransferase n=1 Tax=Streptomyces roseolus TaxID=67358 RepID=UPI0037A3CEB4